MSDLNDATTEELAEELERRKKVKKLKPKLLEMPESSKLKDLCMEYLKQVEKDEIDEDMQHYIFESAMEMFYGDSVWDFINELT